MSPLKCHSGSGQRTRKMEAKGKPFTPTKLSFWRELSEKHGLTEEYNAFMEVKRRANEHTCFACTDNTCCGGAGSSLYGEIPGLEFAQEGRVQRDVNGRMKHLCLMLTEDFMCAVEEAKQRGCLYYYCTRMELTDEERKIWRSFSDVLYKVRCKECGSSLSVNQLIVEWIKERPEYVQLVRERLSL